MDFIYHLKESATADLIIYSAMNRYEDKAVFLVKVSDGYKLTLNLYDGQILMLAINGAAYEPV